MGKKRYFMYGTLMSHDAYLDIKTNDTIEDVLDGNDDIEGIFTGRNGDFVIFGRVLETVDVKNDKPYVIPQLLPEEESLTRTVIEEKFNVTGEYHYYFIIK